MQALSPLCPSCEGKAEGHGALRGGCGVEEGSPTGRADDALWRYFINTAINIYREATPSILLAVLCHPYPPAMPIPYTRQHPPASVLVNGLHPPKMVAESNSYTPIVPSKWPGELLCSLTTQPRPSLIAPD